MDDQPHVECLAMDVPLDPSYSTPNPSARSDEQPEICGLQTHHLLEAIIDIGMEYLVERETHV